VRGELGASGTGIRGSPSFVFEFKIALIAIMRRPKIFAPFEASDFVRATRARLSP
jgi:hypothetical protein